MNDGQAQAQAQPLDPAIQIFQNAVAIVSNALANQGISSIVSRFDGNAKDFREWIKNIEKYSMLMVLMMPIGNLLHTRHQGVLYLGLLEVHNPESESHKRKRN